MLRKISCLSMFPYLLCGLLFLVAACQNTVTHSPMASAQEVAHEQAFQSNMVEGQAFDDRNSTPISVSEYARMEQRVAQVGARVQKASVELCHDVFTESKRNCMFGITLAEREATTLNAYADGEKVVIFPKMVAFTQDNNELALILSHELAHNVMHHSRSQQVNTTIGSLLGWAADMVAASQGLNTGGGFSKLGAQGALLAYSPDFEHEADYVGLYIMSRAGYDIHGAAEFWRRMSVVNPNAIYTKTTHPTNPERYVSIQKTIAEIESKKSSGSLLIPKLKTSS